MTVSEIISGVVAGLALLLAGWREYQSRRSRDGIDEKKASVKASKDEMAIRRQEQEMLDERRDRFIDRLQQQIETVSEETKSLRGDFGRTQIELAGLRVEHAQCQKENKELRESITELREENNEQATEIKELRASVDELSRRLEVRND